MESENITLLDGEEFKQLEDFPDYYVSNCGRVYSTKTHRCIGSPNVKTHYMMVYLSKGKRTSNKYIYDLVAEYFDKPKPVDGAYKIHYIDDDVKNNNINNIEWIQIQEIHNEYTKERKKRLSKREVEVFNRWFIYHRESLMNLSNERIAALFEEETKIPIHPITVRSNRDRWYVDSNDKLCKISDDMLDDVEKILRK